MYTVNPSPLAFSQITFTVEAIEKADFKGPSGLGYGAAQANLGITITSTAPTEKT